MEARSRALDAKFAAEAVLDAEELQQAAIVDDDDLNMDEANAAEDGGDEFKLPTPSEREEEQKTGGPDVHVVQRRIRHIVRVLGKFKKLAEKGRYVLSCASLYHFIDFFS